MKLESLPPNNQPASTTASSSPLPDSRNSPEVEQEIVQKYVESLEEGVKKAIDAEATPVKSSETAAYVAERLKTMGPQDKASMEEFLKEKPGLTAEKYMEEAIAHGF